MSSRNEIVKIILINKATGDVSYFCTLCGYKTKENRVYCGNCSHPFESEEVYYKDESV